MGSHTTFIFTSECRVDIVNSLGQNKAIYVYYPDLAAASVLWHIIEFLLIFYCSSVEIENALP